MRTVKFGIIGCGLMGREFASAVANWYHLHSVQNFNAQIAVNTLVADKEPRLSRTDLSAFIGNINPYGLAAKVKQVWVKAYSQSKDFLSMKMSCSAIQRACLTIF